MWEYYNKFLKRLRWTESWLLVKLTLASLAMLLTLSVLLFFFEEGLTPGDSLWTAYISLTTIGYGDFSAQTWQGRVATVSTTFLGIGCLAIFAGTLIDKGFERRIRKMKGEGVYGGEGHVVIINVPSYEEIDGLLGELDSCREYNSAPRVILAPSLPGSDTEMPSFIMKRIDAFVRGIPSSMATLERGNVKKACACILLSSSSDSTMDDVNTMTAGIIEKNWPAIVTVLNCVRSDTLQNLPFFGIDGGVNSTGMQMGLLVQELKDPGTFEVYSQLSSNAMGQVIYISSRNFRAWGLTNENVCFSSLKKAVIDLNFPVTILGVKKEGAEVVLNVKNEYNVQLEDRLIYMAKERFNWKENSKKILDLLGVFEK
ncbi:MAG: potassium channel family protein [Nitrospinota bacterium]